MVSQALSHADVICTPNINLKTNLLPVSGGGTHTQSSILDRARRKMVEYYVVGNSEDRVIIQTSWRHVIPPRWTSLVPLCLWIDIENDLLKDPGQNGRAGSRRDVSDIG